MEQKSRTHTWNRGVVIAITAIAMTAATLLVLYATVAHHERRAEAYVAKEVVPFIETWEVDIFVSLYPPGLIPDDPRDQLIRDFVVQLSRVGLPTHLDAPEGYVTLAFDSGIVPSLTASVLVKGEFPTGPAHITITLLREEGAWFLGQVSVTSDYLLDMLSD